MKDAPRDIEALLDRLSRNSFRARCHLGDTERATLESKGLATIVDHARSFVADRLAPAHPPRDGRQTPWRGHPVFIAQHATATCCRSCLEKWHGIERGSFLDDTHQNYIVRVIESWLRKESGTAKEA